MVVSYQTSNAKCLFFYSSYVCIPSLIISLFICLAFSSFSCLLILSVVRQISRLVRLILPSLTISRKSFILRSAVHNETSIPFELFVTFLVLSPPSLAPRPLPINIVCCFSLQTCTHLTDPQKCLPSNSFCCTA